MIHTINVAILVVNVRAFVPNVLSKLDVLQPTRNLEANVCVSSTAVVVTANSVRFVWKRAASVGVQKVRCFIAVAIAYSLVLACSSS